MTIILGILLAILVFGLIVFFHELWHFFTAKIFWVKVDEFGIWIPPKAVKVYTDKSGTDYTLNWLPIWWFVKLKWEDYSEESKSSKDSLVSKSIFKQMIIVLAGIFMNFLLASMIFSTLFYFWSEPLAINTKFETQTKTKFIPDLNTAIEKWILEIDWVSLSPMKWSIAENSWIKDWDILLYINQKQITKPEEMINLVKYSTWPLEFKIKRKNEQIIIPITPVNWKIWSLVWYNIKSINKDFEYKYTFWKAIKEWFIETYNESKLTFELLWSLVVKLIKPNNVYERQEAVESLGWPIAVWNLFVNLVNENVKLNIILLIWAVLSINLWVFNLIPFPALDWWRFFIMLINSIIIFFFWKKAIDERIEQFIHFIWFIFLILLSIFVAYKDIFKIFF